MITKSRTLEIGGDFGGENTKLPSRELWLNRHKFRMNQLNLKQCVSVGSSDSTVRTLDFPTNVFKPLDQGRYFLENALLLRAELRVQRTHLGQDIV